MLDTHGIKVRPEKCSWFKQEVEYLGHIVGSCGLRKSPAYIEKVKLIPKPQTTRQLREVLKLLNFQRKFVPHFSTLQKPLSEKTSGKGSKRLEWTNEMDTAFEVLKEKMQEEVQLTFPDYSPDASPLEIYVDASNVGAGACLTQVQGGIRVKIDYSSKTFSAAEQHYSTIERELVALRWGVKAFRPFLIGAEFIIFTDHRPQSSQCLGCSEPES